MAKTESQIVGHCLCSDTGDSIAIDMLYVHKDYQGRGIGRILIKNTLNVLKAKDTVVEVVTYNTVGINFYKKLGFKVLKPVENNQVLPSGRKLPLLQLFKPKS